MGDEYPKSAQFTGERPEDCYRKYQAARRTPGFDEAHYPTLDKFWLTFEGIMPGMKREGTLYSLIVIYGHDISPNM